LLILDFLSTDVTDSKFLPLYLPKHPTSSFSTRCVLNSPDDIFLHFLSPVNHTFSADFMEISMNCPLVFALKSQILFLSQLSNPEESALGTFAAVGDVGAAL